MWSAALDLAVAAMVLAAGLRIHRQWLGTLAGLWLVLALRQVRLALRARRCSL
ncbi:hypothetical protein [Streptomyces violascens]|uniref:Uncharacterized protein n=1 Tax=Streptomyces violascens TaxID=67381 RepID=A0ABQ3QXM8_9ACTN|nr:hypothetical protein [Streptomyces violascens]GGU17811.1 hypothetical protein GCM10010289_44320 [Streptomyces violascens]GHI42024.1 hypothetical protein Sviol_64320 [Streptomyces violascens]